MGKCGKPLLASLLASMFLLVQWAVPWMHVGCQHDHSQTAAGHCHGASCGHNHVHTEHAAAETTAKVAPGSSSADGDCAACRFLLLSCDVIASVDGLCCERIADEVVASSSVTFPAKLAGLYRARAPPQLS